MKLKYKTKNGEIKEYKKPIIDIFIRSYPGDFEWLGYCLKSIKKYCTGFRQIILTVTEDNVEKAKNSEFLDLSGINLMSCDSEYEDDYVGQMITKSQCHLFSDASIFCHVDSDCIFLKQFKITDIIDENGKIIYYYNHYKDVGEAIMWKAPVERFFGFEVDKEFMRCFPMSFLRETYEQVENYCQKNKYKTLKEWVSCEFSKYKRMCYTEFQTLGAYAYFFQNSRYAFFEACKERTPEKFLKQYWSWGGITKETKNQIKQVLL